MKKPISVSNLTLGLYLDYVKPAALAAGIFETTAAHDATWGDYTIYTTDAAAADEIGHRMYCACINAHIALHQYGSEAEARQMLYQLESSIKYHPETAELLTALRNAITAMLPEQPAEAAQEAPAAEAEQQPTETENAPQAATQAAEGTDEQKEEEHTMTTTAPATLAAIAAIIAEAERMRSAYFLPPISSASARRSYERRHSHEAITWTEGGHTYTAAYTVSCSCANVYASGTYTRDGKRTTLTAIRNSYKRMSA